MTTKTNDQVRVANLENQLNEWGYILRTKTSPDRSSTGHTNWSVEATDRHNGHHFVSTPRSTKYHLNAVVYLRVLEDVYSQIKTFRERK